MEKDTAYDGIVLYRVCFACGKAERVDIREEGTPLKVADCPDCGQRMYVMNAVEAYFDRYLGNDAFSEDMFDSMEILDKTADDIKFDELDTAKYDPEKVIPFQVTFDKKDLAFSTKSEATLNRLKKLIPVSQKLAMRMLRVEADLHTRDFGSTLQGIFRPFGEASDNPYSAMFFEGRFTPQDAKRFNAGIRITSKGVKIKTENSVIKLNLREGLSMKWLERTVKSIRASGESYRMFALAANVCKPLEETTVAADISPANVVRDKGIMAYSDLIKAKLGSMSDTVQSIEISKDGKLKLKAESADATLAAVKALAESGIALVSVVEGDILSDVKGSFTPAKLNALKQPSATKLDTDVSNGISKVLADIGSLLNKGKSDFVTLDQLKGAPISDIFKQMEALVKDGYVKEVSPSWAYALTEAGQRRVKEATEQFNTPINYARHALKFLYIEASHSSRQSDVGFNEALDNAHDTLKNWLDKTADNG